MLCKRDQPLLACHNAWRKCNDTPPYSKVSVKNCWKVGGYCRKHLPKSIVSDPLGFSQWQKRSGSETFDLRRCLGARYVRVLTSIDRGRVQNTLTQRYRQFGEELLGYFLKEHDVKILNGHLLRKEAFMLLIGVFLQ